MNLLFVYETQRLMKQDFNFYRRTITNPCSVNVGSKTITHNGSTWYFRDLDHFDYVRGLQYHRWYRMGDWSKDLETWQRNLLDSHCRGEV